MLAYRVFPALDSARSGEPGHPEYLHPQQGHGRLDNPDHYLCWYLALEASGAVGEVFADLLHWRDLMFSFPALPGSRRALGTYEIPDDAPILDLDDARNLLDRNLRPTQVIERNRAATQLWALRVFEERGSSSERRWAGIRWWSFHWPPWRILGLWDMSPSCVRVEPLDLDHPAVVDAAKVLSKPLP